MPTYNFVCESCETQFKDLVKSTKEFAACPNCKTMASPQMSSGGSTVVYEVADKHRDKQIKKGVQSQLKERMSHHHDKYELADKIDKFGENEAKRHGWFNKVKKL